MKKFLTSAADVYGFDENDNLLFVGKTLLDSSIEATLSNTDVRAGKGNALQYIYYHSAELNIAVTEAQWSLEFLSLNVGSAITTGANVFNEETVTLTKGKGAVTGTPLTFSTQTIYGWVSIPDGSDTKVERVEFDGKNFQITDTNYDGNVCVRYYNRNAAARQIVIDSDMTPSVIKLVMEANLNSSDKTTNRIGKVEIMVPRASMTGAFTISMTPDAVASTPLNVRALASTVSTGGCAGNKSIYATITEVIDNANWYDNVDALAVVGGDFTLAADATKLLDVRAVPTTGAAFKPDYDDLTFSVVDGTITVNNTNGATKGTVTGAAGGGTVKVTITSKPEIDVTVKVTAGE